MCQHSQPRLRWTAGQATTQSAQPRCRRVDALLGASGKRRREYEILVDLSVGRRYWVIKATADRPLCPPTLSHSSVPPISSDKPTAFLRPSDQGPGEGSGSSFGGGKQRVDIAH